MKSVIITGANRGIGLETAIAFARAGYQVFATMRNPDKAIELKNKIASESLTTIAISVMDVDSDESVNQRHGYNIGIKRSGGCVSKQRGYLEKTGIRGRNGTGKILNR